jgi:hypothetical protein
LGKKKVFPRVDLSIPGIEHARDSAGRVVIPLDIIPPASTVVRFPEAGNATSRRNFEFSGWYGAGIDQITYACQRQIERFLQTHDGDLSVATVVAYCLIGLRSFLDYLLIHRVASDRTLTLGDINREVIAAYLGFLDDGTASTGAQRTRYGHVKPVLMALGQRGLIRIVTEGDEVTFPANPFPHSHRKAKGERPLNLAQRREFTAAVKTAVTPLLADGAVPTGEFLAYALLVVALHTGRNLTPLVEMGTDCLRAHPRDNMVFLVCYKRRGNTATKVPLREEKAIESISSALPTVAQLIRRVMALTAPLRQQAPAHLQDRVWLFRSQSPRRFGAVSALTPEVLYTATRKLVKDFNLQDANGRPLRINVRRLRKTFTNRVYEFLDDDPVAAARAAGNTPRVLANHYLRPGENARTNWRFMGKMLVQELTTATLGTTEKTPTGRCTDNRQGQYAPKRDGATCMNFLNCLRCRNYVVTGDDLYRLFSFYWRIYAERSRMEIRKWEKHYRHIIRLIDRDVIAAGIERKVFRQGEVDAARERARTEPHPYWWTQGLLEAMQ